MSLLSYPWQNFVSTTQNKIPKAVLYVRKLLVNMSARYADGVFSGCRPPHLLSEFKDLVFQSHLFQSELRWTYIKPVSVMHFCNGKCLCVIISENGFWQSGNTIQLSHLLMTFIITCIVNNGKMLIEMHNFIIKGNWCKVINLDTYCWGNVVKTIYNIKCIFCHTHLNEDHANNEFEFVISLI